jgi:hypothetical protein
MVKNAWARFIMRKGGRKLRVGLTIPSSKQTGGNVLACVVKSENILVKGNYM